MSGQAKITVLVVDDHPLMRFGVSTMINAQRDMEVVAQAGDGREAIEQFRHHQPDVTLMDLRLPGMNGVEAIRTIRQCNPRAHVVVLTTYEGDEDIHQALAAGARGYLVKGMSTETLVDTIRRVYAGLRFLPPPVARTLASRTPNSEVSPREREVLSLVVHGKSNKEIAVLLGITEATVKCHVSELLRRLEVADRTQAVVAALQRGFVHIED
jgi:two-component system, NarL family, response regulator